VAGSWAEIRKRNLQNTRPAPSETIGNSRLKTGTSQVQIIKEDSNKVPSKYVDIE